ncbi:aromatic acid/H+ symport family MFS transporter [Paraburkholderia caribensis]|uniref:4-hydroxybenzoate transporter n=1 Tax=Paraburkholderia caribensis TaxID=75105 RepID=A0A9Q6S7S4_9BURK|nr:aromatic acid/H+ symport family MFS transporter [Paraburkholderia caribensis]MCO4878309.1 aromatic acid/H+ symport family MFS transporter [Paraburkholderia caribensis]PTB28598.1 aromatic acid/H+ symport family MFS transporter [Paraburkholderia caribensis]QLB66096.1 4-hydroxybenzoate transporter [Paraburkholderia caribensis]
MKPRIIDVQQFLDDHRFSAFQWTILVLCFFVVAVDGLDTAAMGFIAPSLVIEWGVTKAALAPVMSAALFGLAIGALTAGPLADKYGRKRVIVASALIFGVASLSSSASWSLWSLTAFRFLTGLGLGAAMPNTVTLISEYAPRSRRALLSTLMFCGFSLGSASSGFVASHIIPAYGWRSLLVVGGVLPLVLVFLLIIVLPESVRFLVCKGAPAARIGKILRRISLDTDFSNAVFTVPEEIGATSESSIKALFLHNNGTGTVLLWVTYFMGLVVVYMLTGWLPTLMKEAGIPLAQAAVVTGMFMFGSTFGTILMGWLMDRMNNHVVMGVSYAAAAICVVAIGMHPGDVDLLRVLVFAAGFAMGAQVSMVILAAQFYQTQYRATGVSWMLGIGRFGGILGASTGGVLMTLGWDFQTIFFGLAIPAVLAAMAVSLKGMYYARRPNAIPVGKGAVPELDVH